MAVLEAGHAVAASAVGLRIVRVWINDNGYGRAHTEGETQRREQIAILMAGQEATAMLSVKAPTHMAGRDREAVFNCIS
jgi:Peptidase M50B-like